LWLIDPEDTSLYRIIEGDIEEVIPIKDNETMRKFMCISKEEASEIIDQVVEKGK